MWQLNFFGPPDPVLMPKSRAIATVQSLAIAKKLRAGQKRFLAEYLRQGLQVARWEERSDNIVFFLKSRFSAKWIPPVGCEDEEAVWIFSVEREVRLFFWKREQSGRVLGDRCWENYPFSVI